MRCDIHRVSNAGSRQKDRGPSGEAENRPAPVLLGRYGMHWNPLLPRVLAAGGFALRGPVISRVKHHYGIHEKRGAMELDLDFRYSTSAISTRWLFAARIAHAERAEKMAGCA